MKKVIIFVGGFLVLAVGVGVYAFTGKENTKYIVNIPKKENEELSRQNIDRSREVKMVDEKDAPERKLLVLEQPKSEKAEEPTAAEPKPKQSNNLSFNQGDAPKVKRAILPLVVKASGSEPQRKKVIRSKNWMPSHRMIPCRLVNTIETRNVVTPVIAMVTEDVMHHGEVVIPAFTEIHGTVGGERDGDRVGAGTTWNLVFQEGKDNGKEMRISGLVLHRADVDDNQEKKRMEMSAGFVGEKLARYPDEMKQIMVLSAYQSGIEAMKGRSTNAFGQEISDGSVKNAGLEAVSQPAELWVDRQLSRLDGDPFFLRVAGGTAFYLYTIHPVDKANAEVGQVIDKEATQQLNEQ